MTSWAPALSIVTGAEDERMSADQAMSDAESVLDQLQQQQQQQGAASSYDDSDDLYAVELHKGEFGLGIYFAANDSGRAAVDADVPFYRLPDGELAPGEASGVISPGDTLVRINDVDTADLALAQVVDELRSVPPGDVRLTFRRCISLASSDADKENNNQAAEAEEEEDEEEPMKEEEVGATASAASTPTSAGKSWSVLQRLSFSTQGSRSNQHTPKRGDKEALVVDRTRELEAALERERKCRFLAEKKNILYRNELLRVSQENAALRDQLARATDDLRKLEIFAQRHLHLPI